MAGEIEAPAQVARVLSYGARAYIPTSVGLTIAVKAISLVEASGVFVPARILSTSPGGGPRDDDRGRNMLTERQVAIADALSIGKANKVIAYELNLSESTVKVHIRNIMKKLKARNRTEVVYKLHGGRFGTTGRF